MQTRDDKLLSLKGQKVNILDSVGHLVSITTTQLCPSGARAAVDTDRPTGVAVFQQNFTY